jgi:hypothetical protein
VIEGDYVFGQAKGPQGRVVGGSGQDSAGAAGPSGLGLAGQPAMVDGSGMA